METFALDLLPGQTLSILLLLGVAPHSLEALRTRVSAKSLDLALLDAALLASPLCLRSAASKALLNRSRGPGRGVTDSAHVDLVHALHGGRHVGESLRALSPRAGCTSVLLACLNGAVDLLALRAQALPEAVVGDVSVFYSATGGSVDAPALRARYRVGEEELRLHTSGAVAALEAAVLGRVGTEA